MKCIKEYYYSDGKCQPVTPIPNCLYYDEFSGVCQECLSSYYLDTNNCILRNVSNDIINCEQNKIDDDLCLECVDNYDLINNNTVCVKKIENCLLYSVSVIDLVGDHEYQCDNCVNGYYLNSSMNAGKGQCIKGSIPKCIKYVNDKNECEQCQFMYYLDSPTECIKSNPTKISPNCISTDSSQPDTCLKCDKGYTMIKRSTQCQLIDSLRSPTAKQQNQCTGWISPSECSSCKPMFFGKLCQNEIG